MGLFFNSTKDHLTDALQDAQVAVRNLQQTNNQIREIEKAIKRLEELAAQQPARVSKDQAKAIASTMHRMRSSSEMLLHGMNRLESQLK